MFTRLGEVELKVIEEALADWVRAQLSCHIPKTYENSTRYYGRYSCGRRGERAKRASPPAEETASN